MNGPFSHVPTNAARLLRRALRAHADGDFDNAERLYNGTLHYDAESFDALHGLGLIHYQRGRVATAVVLFQEALKADLDRANGFADLGLAFHALRRFNEALRSYDEGLRIAPADPELLSRRGVVLLDLGRPAEALAHFDRALAANPRYFDALGNRGNALLKLNRPEQAIAAYDTALTMAPGNAQLLTNRAVALRRLDRPHEAAIDARRALASRPDFAQARFVESVARLTLGDFATGWRGYEARWEVGFLAAQRGNFTVPQWRGEPLAGKTILLHAEQGFGDTIQFVRYAPLLAVRGAGQVVLEVQRELVPLLAPMPGVAAVVARGEALPQVDCHCPLLSLPLAFATELATIPGEVPYIAPVAAAVAEWRARLPQGRPLIGVAWSGERAHDNDANRSLPLAALVPLLDLPDLTFVSLQHQVRDEDAAVLQTRTDLVRIGERFRDFSDTAAVIASLDAVITADTAVAHLAGAMAKPLYLLLPFAADFRWLRERHDSRWYPTARLFRQPKFGDWASVVDMVCVRTIASARRRNCFIDDDHGSSL
jgi:tetratricopeptide (TPR) repeat protein